MNHNLHTEELCMTDALIPHDDGFAEELLNVKYAYEQTGMSVIPIESVLYEMRSDDRYVGSMVEVVGWIRDGRRRIEPPLQGRRMEYRGVLLEAGEIRLGVHDREGDQLYSVRIGEAALSAVITTE